MRKHEKRKLVAEINVVPYIDVMLVLLVIFMITTPLLNQGVKVDLPKASAQALASNKEPIIVSVDQTGNYYLNIAAEPEKSISADELVLRIKAEIELNKNNPQEQRSILIKGDNGVNYGKVVEAMALLQQAGVEHVGLMTDPITSH